MFDSGKSRESRWEWSGGDGVLPATAAGLELSLAVEHGMLLREECSIVFTLINRRPTLPPPRPLVFCSDETHAFLYTNMHFFRYIVRRW
uniref:Uncharacterized protein n=1 Tax=Oryza glumipatula TaxID=40148 RepID=A0A0D9Z2S3_9ORYZ